MAARSEEAEMIDQAAPNSPTECGFSEEFFKRNQPENLPNVPVVEETSKLFTENKNNPQDSQEDSETLDSHSERSEPAVLEVLEGRIILTEDNLIDAIKQDRVDAVRKLLNEQCDPNEPEDAEGNRPLHWAVFAHKTECVRLLLEAGADVNLASQKTGATPVMITPALFRHKNAPWGIVHKLLQTNCDINRLSRAGKSTLHSAVQLGNVELVQVLLQYSVNIDVRDSKKRTPVMYAALLSCADILQYSTNYTLQDVERIVYLLIKENCDVFCTDKFHQNALYLSIPNVELCDPSRKQGVSFRIVRMLILAGAKPPPKRLLRRWDSVSKRAAGDVKKVIGWIEKQRTCVKSLHHCCRIVIRRAIGQSARQKLKHIVLPDKIKDFLLLPEIDDLESDIFSL